MPKSVFLTGSSLYETGRAALVPPGKFATLENTSASSSALDRGRGARLHHSFL